MLNNLLQYIEVNLTAIRKIFKKFEKKVPAEIRVRNVRDYKAHHDLFMPSMQHMLVTAVQIQRLVLVAEATDGSEGAKGAFLTQIGPESLALLTWLCGPAAVDEVLGTLPAARIDVYAKPGGLPADTAHATPGGATTQASAGGQAAVAVPVRQAFQAAAVGQAQANQAQMQCQGQALQAENESPRDESPEDAGGEDLVSKTGRRRGGRNNRSGGRGRKAYGVVQSRPALSPACTEIGKGGVSPAGAGRSGGKGGRVSKGAEQGFGIFGQMPAMVGAMQGTDPNLLAAMMPMFWPAPIAPQAG
ncbi:unnamed protein product [Polarella glacialis]|uniref:SPX domain-containing protein n=1 Tax=Polarella glacialis TaxID=89957 RepID=A0A813M402_POLGL|nr:unnamed protein product [Polarella glacialis]